MAGSALGKIAGDINAAAKSVADELDFGLREGQEQLSPGMEKAIALKDKYGKGHFNKEVDSILDDMASVEAPVLKNTVPAPQPTINQAKVSEADDILNNSLPEFFGQPPTPTLARGSLSLNEAEQALKYYDSTDYDELSKVPAFVKDSPSVPKRTSDLDYLPEWVDSIGRLPASPVNNRRSGEIRDVFSGQPAKQLAMQEKLDPDAVKAQDIQMLLNNRRFYPDRVFQGEALDNLWKYLGDDYMTDGEGNPVVLFRTGTPLGENGFARAFSGEHEFSAHAGSQSAALDAGPATDPEGAVVVFGGKNKTVDIYYTNIKKPLQLPDLGTWGTTNILNYLRSERSPIPDAIPALDEMDSYVARLVQARMNQVEKGSGNKLTGMDLFETLVRAEQIPQLKDNIWKWAEGQLAGQLKDYLTNAHGYDAISYRNEHEASGSLSFLPFYPQQMKSIRNVGTFDPKVEHNLKSILGGTVVTGAAAGAAATKEGNTDESN